MAGASPSTANDTAQKAAADYFGKYELQRRIGRDGMERL
jgi:hypothetical protein